MKYRKVCIHRGIHAVVAWGKGKSALELKIPPLIVFIVFAAAMWLLSLWLPGFSAPDAVTLAVCAALQAVGIACILTGGITFGKAGTTVNPTKPEGASSLVTSGIYRFTRNPMYVGFLLMLVGWGVYLSNLYSVALSAGFVLYMNRFQILPEERILEGIFGQEFLAYKKRVRRWL